MKLLLHICCAPCSVACVQSLRAEGIEPTGYWYNPNIHPFTEYRQRRNTLVEYAESIGMALEMDDEYGLRPFTPRGRGACGRAVFGLLCRADAADCALCRGAWLYPFYQYAVHQPLSKAHA